MWLTMKKTVVVGILTSLIITICLSTFSSVGASTTTTSFVGKGQVAIYVLNLQAGQQVTGSFVIAGERIHVGEYFYFKILDPRFVVFDDITCYYVNQQYNFSFKVFTTGDHNFTFTNSGSYDRYVDITYNIENESLPPESTPLVTNPPEPTPTPTVPEFQSWIVASAIVTTTLLSALIIRKHYLS
jgi:hypothetical protein